ncbi:hypothetical protein CTAYLR_005721 [Chrysophaeum taylorii]|uniref:AsmA-like C-terminal domain-containing protein n=1 Tax=Chrysophaeum taylorii TaxID=2483200 RepID=A0AAD7XL51_9STRA|nr:hypothetical protein CTAYLR_005721 [Chrysophaeum taylorii]
MRVRLHEARSRRQIVVWVLSFALTADALATTRVQPTSTFYRRTSLDTVEFGGRLNIDSTFDRVDPLAFAEFLTPVRVVGAAWDPKMVEALGDHAGSEVFRLKQEPFDFAGVLRVATSVDVRVRQIGTGLELESRDIDCRAAIGLAPPQKVDLAIRLNGVLDPQDAPVARLRGSFDLTVSGRLFGPVLLLPDPVLKTAAIAVNTGILGYARNRFVTGIYQDFQRYDNGA